MACIVQMGYEKRPVNQSVVINTVMLEYQVARFQHLETIEIPASRKRFININ
jgi:hypothetical protein